jgi:hypothetical protein
MITPVTLSDPGAAVFPTPAVGAAAGAGAVQGPAAIPASGGQVPHDGVDGPSHADIVLKEVLMHAEARPAQTATPLRTPEMQLALAQHREPGASPLLEGRFDGGAGRELPGPVGRAAAEPASAGPGSVAASASPASAGAELTARAGQPTGQPAAPPAGQGQPPLQAPAAAALPASAFVNPNPPPPLQAAIAREQRRRERWRPRAPRTLPGGRPAAGQGRDGDDEGEGAGGRPR